MQSGDHAEASAMQTGEREGPISVRQDSVRELGVHYQIMVNGRVPYKFPQ